MPRRLLLLGDSTIDNKPYVGRAPDTTAHLQEILGTDWQVTRLARDGAVMHDVSNQLRHISDSADVAVLSVGGNDAIGYVPLLESKRVDSRAYLGSLRSMSESFAESYKAALAQVAPIADRLITCTIYEARIGDPETFSLARVALSILNDRIFRASAEVGADILDLRTVCTEDSDFVMQIEPSAEGAEKIARAIAAVLQGERPGSRLLVGGQ